MLEIDQYHASSWLAYCCRGFVKGLGVFLDNHFYFLPNLMLIPVFSISAHPFIKASPLSQHSTPSCTAFETQRWALLGTPSIKHAKLSYSFVAGHLKTATILHNRDVSHQAFDCFATIMLTYIVSQFEIFEPHDYRTWYYVIWSFLHAQTILSGALVTLTIEVCCWTLFHECSTPTSASTPLVVPKEH